MGHVAAIDGKDIVYHDFVNVSVAVAGPKGLVTPVLRHCELKSIAEIEKDLGEAAKKAREGQLAMEDFDGGTITISNGGMLTACGRSTHLDTVPCRTPTPSIVCIVVNLCEYAIDGHGVYANALLASLA